MNAETRATLVVTFAVAWLGAGCGAGDPISNGGPPDSGSPATLPAWMLEDIQPQSPRAGETYGLDAFAGKIVVVTLLDGF